MAGIFPNSGVPANQAAGSVDVPTTGCQELFHDTGRCSPRFDPLAANSLMSEVLNVVSGAGLTYNCANLTNLRDAIDAMIAEVSPCSATVPDASAAVVNAMQANPALLRFPVCHADATPSAVRIDGTDLLQIIGSGSVTVAGDYPLPAEDTRGATAAYVALAVADVSPCGADAITAPELAALQADLSTGKVAVCIPSGAGSKVVSVPADDLLSSAGFNHMGALQRAVLQGPLAVMYDDGSAFTPAEVAPYGSTFTVPAGVTHVAVRIEVGSDEYESVTIVPVSTGDTISAAPASGQPRLNGVLMDGAFLQANGVQPVLVPDFEIGHLGTTLNGTALWQAANTRYTIMGCTLV